MLETTNNSTGEKIRIEFNQKYQKKSEIKSLAHAVYCLPFVYDAQVAFKFLIKGFQDATQNYYDKRCLPINRQKSYNGLEVAR